MQSVFDLAVPVAEWFRPLVHSPLRSLPLLSFSGKILLANLWAGGYSLKTHLVALPDD